MARLQGDLAKYPDVRLVSFSVVPDTTPRTLGHTRRTYHADADRWLFLTGEDAERVRDFIQTNFKQTALKGTASDRRATRWTTALTWWWSIATAASAATSTARTARSCPASNGGCGN